MITLFIVPAFCICLYSCANEEKGGGVNATTDVSPSEMYISKIIECLNHSEGILDDIVLAADAAAARLAVGGRIYVTDDETIFRTGKEETSFVEGGGYSYPMHKDWGGFVAEACDRAGGLRFIKPVPITGTLTEHDVVLAGTLELNPESQIKQLKSYKDSGALVILFGSRDSQVAKYADNIIENGLATGIVPVMDIGTDKPIGPVGGIANIINSWTFTAELVAALTRCGKMPALWQSMFVPDAAPRNEKIGDYIFHPDMKIEPVNPGNLGRQYITALQDFMGKIKLYEMARFSEAGKLCAETISGGKKVVAGIIGHFMTSQLRMPGYPDIFSISDNKYGSEQLEGILESGDVWLHVGYSYYPERELKYSRKVGAKTICVFAPGPTDIGEGWPVKADMSLIDIYIDPYWKHGDAVVEVPGYDVRIIPPSGVVMISCYWMLIGETMASLK